MDIEKLKAFRAAVEAGSMTQAAQRLGYSQPGLTGMLNRLEDEIGYPLLQRGAGGVTLTAAGTELLPHIDRLLQESRAFERAVELCRPTGQEQLRVGSYTSISKNWLPRIIKGFSAQNPQIQLTVKDGTLNEIEAWLEEGLVDIGLLSHCFTARLDFIPLLQDRFYAVLPPEEDPGETFSIEKFEGRVFFNPSNGLDLEVPRLLNRYGVSPRFSNIATEDSAVIKMVEQGLGCSILSELILRGTADRVNLAPIDPPAFREVGAAVKNLKKASPAAKSFLAYMKKSIQKEPEALRGPEGRRKEQSSL